MAFTVVQELRLKRSGNSTAKLQNDKISSAYDNTGLKSQDWRSERRTPRAHNMGSCSGVENIPLSSPRNWRSDKNGRGCIRKYVRTEDTRKHIGEPDVVVPVAAHQRRRDVAAAAGWIAPRSSGSDPEKVHHFESDGRSNHQPSSDKQITSSNIGYTQSHGRLGDAPPEKTTVRGCAYNHIPGGLPSADQFPLHPTNITHCKAQETLVKVPPSNHESITVVPGSGREKLSTLTSPHPIRVELGTTATPAFSGGTASDSPSLLLGRYLARTMANPEETMKPGHPSIAKDAAPVSMAATATTAVQQRGLIAPEETIGDQLDHVSDLVILEEQVAVECEEVVPASGKSAELVFAAGVARVHGLATDQTKQRGRQRQSSPDNAPETVVPPPPTFQKKLLILEKYMVALIKAIWVTRRSWYNHHLQKLLPPPSMTHFCACLKTGV